MKYAPVAAALMAAAFALPAAADQNKTIIVPGGTAVPMHVLGSISSGNVKEGDTFTVQAAEDVVVNGMIVVKKGAAGQGTIEKVDHAGWSGHSGSLSLDFTYVYAVDGGKVRLSNDKQQQAEEDRKGASSTATIIGIATFGIGGLFGHNLAHGREVTIDPEKTLTAFVASNVHVRTSDRAQTDHYDH